MPAPKDFVQMWRDLQRRVTQLEQRRIRELGYEGLRNPVKGDVTTALISNFPLTTSMTTLASVTWPVPDGFNQAQISVAGKVFAFNSTAGLDYVNAQIVLVRVSDGASLPGVSTPVAVSGSGGSGTGVALGVGVIALLAGDSVRIELRGMSNFGAWAANVGNLAEVSGSLNWYRS